MFFILLTINVLITGICGFFIYKLFKQPEDYSHFNEEWEIVESNSPFSIHTSKHQLTSIINHYLLKSDTDFTISLEEVVELTGHIELLGMKMNVRARFEPIVDPGGNLILHQQSVDFGLLQIPNHYALLYMQNMILLPDFVVLYPFDETIFIDSSKINLGDTLTLTVQEFNLAEDNIVFNVHLIDLD